VAYRIFVGKPAGKRPLGRPRRRWSDNIKMDPREDGGSMDWIDLDEDRRPLEGSCIHGNEPSGSIKYWEVLEWLHNWRFLNKLFRNDKQCTLRER
jgi:hypothetical protein